MKRAKKSIVTAMLFAALTANSHADVLLEATLGYRVLPPMIWGDARTLVFACQDTAGGASETMLCALQEGSRPQIVTYLARPVVCDDPHGKRTLLWPKTARAGETVAAFVVGKDGIETADEPAARELLDACTLKRFAKEASGCHRTEIRDVPGYRIDLREGDCGSSVQTRGPSSQTAAPILRTDWHDLGFEIEVGQHAYRAVHGAAYQQVFLYPNLSLQQRRVVWKSAGSLRVYRVQASGDVSEEAAPWHPMFEERFYQLVPTPTGFLVAITGDLEKDGELGGVWKYDGSGYRRLWAGHVENSSATLDPSGTSLTFLSRDPQDDIAAAVKHSIVEIDLRNN